MWGVFLKKDRVVEVRSVKREEFIDITARIQHEVSDMGIKDGFVLIYVPHTTAALMINENADPDVLKDISRYLSEAVPRYNDYLHGEGNSDAHIKSAFLGVSKHLPVRDGKLLLGTWQGIFFGEFDGPRNRRVIIAG